MRSTPSSWRRRTAGGLPDTVVMSDGCTAQSCNAKDKLLRLHADTFPCVCLHCRWIGRHFGSVRKLLGGSQASPAIDTLQTLEEDTELTREEFKQLLETIDSGLRALPATAQVCLVL